MKQIITEENFPKIKALRAKNPDLTVDEFRRLVYVKGITDRVPANSTMYYLLPASSCEEFRRRQSESRRKYRKGRLEETVSCNNSDKKNCDLQEDDADKKDEKIGQIVTLVDELRHTNHLLDALFAEEKNQSRLIQQLIDLWRR